MVQHWQDSQEFFKLLLSTLEKRFQTASAPVGHASASACLYKLAHLRHDLTHQLFQQSICYSHLSQPMALCRAALDHGTYELSGRAFALDSPERAVTVCLLAHTSLPCTRK